MVSPLSFLIAIPKCVYYVVFGFIPSIAFSSVFSYNSIIGELISIFTAIITDTIPGKE
jgi:hypothetical protein